MIRDCEKCGRRYDDLFRWTLCPHRPLGEAPRQVDPVNETRVKTLFVGQDELLTLLICLKGNLVIFRWEGIPDGIRVLGVDYSAAARGFYFVISHPTFDPVPAGHIPPPFEVGLSKPVLSIRLDGYEEAVRAFLKYGKHLPDCGAPDRACSCGYLTAMREVPNGGLVAIDQPGDSSGETV